MPENIATNILSDRLLKLKQEGLIIKNKSEADKHVYYYYPTQKAIDSFSVVLDLKYWSEKYLFTENETPTSIMPLS